MIGDNIGESRHALFAPIAGCAISTCSVCTLNDYTASDRARFTHAASVIAALIDSFVLACESPRRRVISRVKPRAIDPSIAIQKLPRSEINSRLASTPFLVRVYWWVALLVGRFPTRSIFV